MYEVKDEEPDKNSDENERCACRLTQLRYYLISLSFYFSLNYSDDTLSDKNLMYKTEKGAEQTQKLIKRYPIMYIQRCTKYNTIEFGL